MYTIASCRTLTPKMSANRGWKIYMINLGRKCSERFGIENEDIFIHIYIVDDSYNQYYVQILGLP